MIFISAFIQLAQLSAYAQEFTSSRITTREMKDTDQLSCLHHYGGFMKAGDNFPVIGGGDKLFANAEGCGQCVKLTNKENGKSAIGMINDFCPIALKCTGDQLDIAPVLSEALGFAKNGKTYHNPDSSSISVAKVPCTDKAVSLGGKLRFYFGAGSSATSQEMIILGGLYPIKGVTMEFEGKSMEGTRESGKWKFLLTQKTSKFLKKNSKVKFIVTFTEGAPVTETIDISKITSPGNAFFTMEGKRDSDGNNHVDSDGNVFNWPDFVDGETVLSA